MAEICTGLLTADLLIDCENPAIGGIEVNAVLINRQDIDLTATKFSLTNKELITNLALKAGKKGYKFQGIKQILGAGFELVKKELSLDKWAHSFTGSIMNLDAISLATLQELSQGANLVAVIETKYKGAEAKQAFKVLGFNSGLELNTATWSANDNEGTIQLELRSVDGFEEPRVMATLLETDYATTKTAFDNSFASA